MMKWNSKMPCIFQIKQRLQRHFRLIVGHLRCVHLDSWAVYVSVSLLWGEFGAGRVRKMFKFSSKAILQSPPIFHLCFLIYIPTIKLEHTYKTFGLYNQVERRKSPSKTFLNTWELPGLPLLLVLDSAQNLEVFLVQFLVSVNLKNLLPTWKLVHALKLTIKLLGLEFTNLLRRKLGRRGRWRINAHS